MRKLSFIFGREKGGLPGAITQFAFVELEQATNRFSNTNLVGLGGSSNVYRGELNGVGAVAIKKLKAIGDDYEFLTEVSKKFVCIFLLVLAGGLIKHTSQIKLYNYILGYILL